MYPITFEADYKAEPNRWTTFFRILLAIPWFLVAIFWSVLFAFTHFFAWVAIIVLGRYPRWLYEFNTGVIRFGVRTGAWLYMQTDAWPPFGTSDDPSYPIRVNFPPPAAQQSRLKALFRLILALPLLLVIYVGVSVIQNGASAIAWLTIVFRGYMPQAVHEILTYANGFMARFSGYIAFVTDDYPPIGLEKAKPAPAAAPASPPPAEPA